MMTQNETFHRKGEKKMNKLMQIAKIALLTIILADEIRKAKTKSKNIFLGVGKSDLKTHKDIYFKFWS